MNAAGKYVLTALLVAIAAHIALVHAWPRVMMATAMDRLSAHAAYLNSWRRSDRVTEASRTIVRPSPDLQYSACVYDLSHGPVVIRVAPWPAYWSVSLYAADSDNYFVLDDREAHDGAEIALVRAGRAHPKHAGQVVESPSERGIALVRRLAPSGSDFDRAVAAAQTDICAKLGAS